MKSLYYDKAILMFKVAVLFAFLSALPLAAYTFSPTNELQAKVDSKILQGLDELHNGDYVKTLDTFQEVINLEPEHPAGYFYYAAAVQWLISDYRNFNYRDVFMEYIDKTIERADAMLDKNEKDYWAYLYYGAALGFRGVYLSDNGNFFAGFRDGTKSYRYLKKAVQYEPRLYDVYYGIGLYDFYKAFYLEKFFWLGEGTRTKQDGIDGIMLSIEKGKYAKVEAQMTLIRVYYENQDYQKAIDIAEKLVARFPKYLFGAWFLARTYADVGEYEKSFQTYLNIKEQLEESIFKSKTSFFEIDYQISMYYAQKGETKKAYRMIVSALEIVDELDLKLKYVKKYVNAAMKLKKSLEKKLDQKS